MDKAEFWKLVDASRAAADGDCDAHMKHLQKALERLPPEEIVAFDRIYREYHDRAYDWDLWGAAYLIGGGCSDDGFMDFRGWLISQGEKAYEAALADPETLADVVPEGEDGQAEGFGYLAFRAWEKKTGKSHVDFPKHDLPYREEPTGTQWEEDALEERFPRLAEKFG